MRLENRKENVLRKKGTPEKVSKNPNETSFYAAESYQLRWRCLVIAVI
jgi:hypothetical protein